MWWFEIHVLVPASPKWAISINNPWGCRKYAWPAPAFKHLSQRTAHYLSRLQSLLMTPWQFPNYLKLVWPLVYFDSSLDSWLTSSVTRQVGAWGKPCGPVKVGEEAPSVGRGHRLWKLWGTGVGVQRLEVGGGRGWFWEWGQMGDHGFQKWARGTTALPLAGISKQSQMSCCCHASSACNSSQEPFWSSQHGSVGVGGCSGTPLIWC